MYCLPIGLLGQQMVTVMTYNILNYTTPSNSNPFGNDANRTQLFRQIVEFAAADIIIIQELKQLSAATQLVNELNANGILGKTYAHAPSFTSYGTLGNMLIYNDNLFDFVSQQELPITNSILDSDGVTPLYAPRAVSKYVMDLVNPDCPQQSTQILFYGAHLKASQGNENRDRRLLGVLDLFDDVNLQPAGTNIIFGCDCNFYDVNEPGYLELLDVANAQPLVDELGPWVRNNNAEAIKYTQSTRNASFNEYGNGGAHGGMDDRFDFLFVSGSINTGSNYAAYQAGTYATLGNAGVATNDNASSGTSPIALEVQQMSDHFPVILTIEVDFDPADACNNCTAPAGFVN